MNSFATSWLWGVRLKNDSDGRSPSERFRVDSDAKIASRRGWRTRSAGSSHNSSLINPARLLVTYVNVRWVGTPVRRARLAKRESPRMPSRSGSTLISRACIFEPAPDCRPSAASARRHDQAWQTYASSFGESRIAGLRDLCCARFSRYAVPLRFLVSLECGG